MLVLPCAALQLRSRRVALGAFSGVAVAPLVASAADDKPNLSKMLGGSGDGKPVGFPNSGSTGKSSKSINEAWDAATGFDADTKKLKNPGKFTDAAFDKKAPCTPTKWKQCPTSAAAPAAPPVEAPAAPPPTEAPAEAPAEAPPPAEATAEAPPPVEAPAKKKKK